MSDASKIDDGGAAFPVPDRREVIMQGSPGLTKRDYFAAAALTGYVARFESDESTCAEIASWALEIADAMIAASKTGGPEHG